MGSTFNTTISTNAAQNRPATPIDIKKDIRTYVESVSRMFEIIKHEAEYLQSADARNNGQFANTISALESARRDMEKVVAVVNRIDAETKSLDVAVNVGAALEELRALAESGKKAVQDAEEIMISIQRSSMSDMEKLWQALASY